MTPRRKAALQWFYDRGAVLKQLAQPDAPHACMLTWMQDDEQIELTDEGWVLTDKGRRELWEATR